MDELRKKYNELLEDYEYVLNIVRDKNEEISNLEVIIDSLIDKIQGLEDELSSIKKQKIKKK